MAEMTALVVGATGAVARRLVELLSQAPGWSVIGLCRNPPAAPGPTSPSPVRYVAVDVLDGAECRRKLAGFREVTHIFHCGRAKHGEGGVENVVENLAMLRHVLDAVEAASPALRHVNLVQGGKYYGQHLGPYPTPAREDDPRHLPPNFYYDLQDLLVERQRGSRWSWTAARPNAVCDFAPGRGRNLVSILGTYAAICAELGVPLDFPGRPGAYHGLTEATEASLLARALRWMATEPGCANQAFNVTNGDLYRWKRFWPRLARHYDLPPGEVRPLRLTEWMADKEPVWQRIVQRHGLAPSRLEDVTHWGFADFTLGQEYDIISSMTCARLLGFHEMVDTEAMFLRLLGEYRDAKILP